MEANEDFKKHSPGYSFIIKQDMATRATPPAPPPPPPSTFTVVTKSINYPSCLQSVIVQKFLTDFRGDLEKKYTTKIILFCFMYHLHKRYFVICMLLINQYVHIVLKCVANFVMPSFDKKDAWKIEIDE